MGTTTRWFLGLLGGSKKSQVANSIESSETQRAKEKKKRGFGKSSREKRLAQELRRSYGSEILTKPAIARAYGAGAVPTMDDENERNNREIAVRVATAAAEEVAVAAAAAAKAAVAAAQAAAAVMRLTRSGLIVGAFGDVNADVCFDYGKREERAAVKIQSVFRGYLARRALTALRGLVKVQALVRGNIVRKQAAERLRCMQTLIRIQTRARACRALALEKRMSERCHRNCAVPLATENFKHALRVGAIKSDGLGTSRRNSLKALGVDDTNSEKFIGQNWLEGWMEERSFDSRPSSRRSGIHTSRNDDKSNNVVEADRGKPRYNNQRWNSCSPCSTLTSNQNSRSFATTPDSSLDSTTLQQSILSSPSVDMQQCMSIPGFQFDAWDYEERPQFYFISSRPGISWKGPFTSTKSECSRTSSREFSGDTNYLSSTDSSERKPRSQCVPKQRPGFENLGCIKRSVARVDPSGLTPASLRNKASPGSGRLDRRGMPVTF